MYTLNTSEVFTKLQNGGKGITFDHNGKPLMYKQPKKQNNDG